MPDTATPARPATIIDLPRYPDESAKAYRARVAYITMGAGRSLDKTRKKLGKDSVGYTRTLETWSERYRWGESARKYDSELVLITLAEAEAAYKSDLADYRKRYGEAGKGLFAASVRLLARINKAVETMDIVGPGALALAANGLKTAADLEALALRVEALLGRLSDAEPGTE